MIPPNVVQLGCLFVFDTNVVLSFVGSCKHLKKKKNRIYFSSPAPISKQIVMKSGLYINKNILMLQSYALKCCNFLDAPHRRVNGGLGGPPGVTIPAIFIVFKGTYRSFSIRSTKSASAFF